MKKYHLNFIKSLIIFIFFILLSYSYGNPYHQFFVSISEIEYNASEKSVEIAIKVFTDDLEKALNTRFNQKMNLNTSQESGQAQDFLKKYLNENFAISIDGMAFPCIFIGKEKEDDATWCYLEVKNVASLSTIMVKNAVLTEIYESQNNIVHVKVRGTSKSMMLKRGNLSGTVRF